MEPIKLGDLYLSKSELDDIVELVAKKRHIKDYQNKSSNSLSKIFKKQSKNKERIDNIREELKSPLYNISKKESKDIKSNLYTIEKTKKISTKKTSKYLDKLDKRIQELDKYKDYDDYEYKGIKNIAIGEPILIKSSLDKPITLYEYFNLVEERLIDLMKEHRDQEEIKVQLTTEINLV